MTPDVVDLTDRSRRRRTWLALQGWTAVVIIHALALSAQANLPLVYAVLSSAVNIYTLAMVAALATRLAARWELWREPPFRALGMHLVMALAALACWSVVQASYLRLTVGPAFWSLVYENTWMFQLVTTAAIYGASVGLTLTIQSMDRESVRARRESQLELTARQGELMAVKAQLQPHFLLNSLNSVVALMEESPAEAREMLLRLSSLLQSTFDRMELAEVPLARELDSIRDYLEVERVRFGDRLTFEINAAPALEQLPVPPFILQPLVENAVKHGIEPFAPGGRVCVEARRAGRGLELVVRDSGTGFSGAAPRTGRGIELTERRLAAIYGGDATLGFASEPAGFTARLRLPLNGG